MVEPSHVLVLGVGNLVRRDEGFGVHVVRHLGHCATLPANVTLLDGGTAGPALLGAILECARLIVIDVARLGVAPGTLARLEGDALATVFGAKQSAHDWGLHEVLLQARLVGHTPDVVIIAAEPQDMDTWSDELTPLLAARVPDAAAMVLAEIGSSVPSPPRRCPLLF